MARSGFESTIDVRPDDAFATPPPGASVSGLPVVDRGSYHVVGEFAKGGIGRILRARDPYLDRPVALKELLEGGGEAEERFLREALVTARLQHPSIVPIYEAGRWPTGEPFYAMKLVSGRPLIEAIERAPTLAERLALVPHVLAVAEAMAYAHGERIIHRDLKPQNILLGEFGETIIIDWGLAKSLAPEVAMGPEMGAESPAGQDAGIEPPRDGAALTVAGAVMGTPLYMAPEQALGLPVDERADVYALGAILYHVLAGAPAYEGQGVAEILTKVMTEPPPPLEKRTQGIPTDLLAIVQKAMCPDVEGRYRTAKELAEDLRRFQTGQIVAAHRYSAIERFRRFVKRNRAPLAVASMALVFIAIGASFSVMRILDAQHRAEQKQLEAETSERRAISRADELTIAQARASLDHDPTKSIALLKSLSPAWAQWGAVRTIAADAEARGISRIFREHSAGVQDVTFSPDGHLLVSVGDDQRVVVHDFQSGDSTVLSGHTDEVWRAAFSPDGKILATAGRDTKIHLWELSSHHARVLESHGAPVTDIQFSPDGKYLASCGFLEKVRLWDIATGAGRVLSRTNESRKNIGGCVAFSGDGATLAFADDGGLALVNLASGERKLFTGVEPGGVEMAFSPDGSRLVTGGESGSVRLWNVTTGASEAVYDHIGDRVTSVAFGAGGQHVISSGFDDGFKLWNVTRRELRTVLGHTGIVRRTVVSRDGTKIVTAGGDGSIRSWEIASGTTRIFRGLDEGATCAAISPDGRFVAGGGGTGTVRLWTAMPGGRIAMPGPFLRATISPDGMRVAMLGVDGQLRVSNSATLSTVVLRGPVTQPPTFPPGLALVPGLKFSNDSAELAAVYDDGTMRIHRLNEGEVRVLRGHMGQTFAIAFAPKGRSLVSGGSDGTVRV